MKISKCKVQNYFSFAVTIDGLAKSPHSVILRSEATKNLNDIIFFAIPFVILRASAHQNDNGVFFRLFMNLSTIDLAIISFLLFFHFSICTFHFAMRDCYQEVYPSWE